MSWTKASAPFFSELQTNLINTMKKITLAASLFSLFLFTVSAGAQSIRLSNVDWSIFAQPGKHANISVVTEGSDKGQIDFTATPVQENTYFGIFHSVPCKTGATIHFECSAKAIKVMEQCTGHMYIEWKDADGAEIERERGPSMSENLSLTDASKLEMSAQAPAKAVTATLVINMEVSGPGSANGVFRIQSISFK